MDYNESDKGQLSQHNHRTHLINQRLINYITMQGVGYISNSQLGHTGSCNTQVRKCSLFRLGVVQIQVVKQMLKNITIRYQSHRKKFNVQKGGYITSELVIRHKHSTSVAVKLCVVIIFT